MFETPFCGLNDKLQLCLKFAVPIQLVILKFCDIGHQV